MSIDKCVNPHEQRGKPVLMSFSVQFSIKIGRGQCCVNEIIRRTIKEAEKPGNVQKGRLFCTIPKN